MDDNNENNDNDDDNDDNNDERCCYVCLEPCDAPSRCACTDRFIHTACLVKMVESNGFNSTCSVCTQPLSNVKISNLSYKTRPTRLLVMLVVATVVAFIEIVICVISAVRLMYMPGSGQAVIAGTALCALSSVVAVLYTRRRAWMRYRAGMPVWTYSKPVNAKISVV